MTRQICDRLLLGAGVVFMLLWYSIVERLVLHLPFDLDLFHPSLLGQAFNSMAEHLVRGRFDVDAEAIDSEAFIVDGRTVAYFGVFCALLRLPLLPFPALRHVDITWVSCLTATVLGAWFQLRAVLLARESVPAGQRRDWLTMALVMCILLGGQQVQFLRPSIFQEVVDWSGALAMGFVFLAVRGLLTERGFDAATLTGMACFAGFALLARVSTGLGLYVALGGLLLVHWQAPRRGIPALAVLLAFMAVAGVVNYGRWGNPLVFADFTKYAMNQDVTIDRPARLAKYGEFNLRRIPLALSYYFVPIWVWVRGDGQLLFAEAQQRLFDAMELPAGSFLLSDPLLLGLAIIGVTKAKWSFAPQPGENAPPPLEGGGGVRGRAARIPPDLPLPPPPSRTGRGRAFPIPRLFTPSQGKSALALLAGLAVPPILMLCAISTAFRYRIEFFPFLVLAALIGMRALCLSAPLPFGRAARTALIVAVLTSIIVSHALAVLYAVSPWGPAQPYIAQDGWIGTYAPRQAAGHD